MATTFAKHYIGKGTQVKDLEIIKVFISLPFDEKAVFEKEGKQYLSFEVSRMKEPDKFGRTHTCYFVLCSRQNGLFLFAEYYAFCSRSHIKYEHLLFE